jgi:hypothetical protein
MSRITKIAILIFTHLIAILIGIVIAFSFFEESMKDAVLEANASIPNTGIIFRYAAYLEFVRNEGDVGKYKEALHSYLDALNNHSVSNEHSLDKNYVNSEKMYTATRLALLFQKEGTTGDFESYTSLAESYCKEAGLKLCDRDKLLNAVRLMDEKYDKKYSRTKLP